MGEVIVPRSNQWRKGSASRRSQSLEGRCILRTRDDRIDVEDQGDPPVAENGGCRNPWNMPVIGLQTLDDDLALALDRIDEKSAARAAFSFYKDGDTFERVGGLRAVVELAADIDQGRELIADRDDPGTAAKAMNIGHL